MTIDLKASHARPRGQSRDALLNAASALMGERDTIDISITEIAAGAGVNHAMIKYHFGSKEGLLLALIERDMEEAVAGLDQLLALDATPTEKMRLHLRAAVDTYHRHPYLNRLTQAMIRDAEPERKDRIGGELLSRIAGAQATILQEGMESGEFRKIDPKLFYFTTIGASDGLYSNRFTVSTIFGGVPNVDEAMHRKNRDQLVELLMRGLKA